MRIDATGRVMIPEAIRRQAGLDQGVELEIEYDGEGIRIVPRTASTASLAPLLSPEEIRVLLGSA